VRDRPLSPLALDVMARATVVQMRDDAAELAQLVRDVRRRLPPLPSNPAEREAVLMVMLLQARDRSRRLLTLVDVRS
jgi:hypothetical protein